MKTTVSETDKKALKVILKDITKQKEYTIDLLRIMDASDYYKKRVGQLNKFVKTLTSIIEDKDDNR